ncbi:Stu1p SCDLUD_000768 [Saccharomycodes ludwigii]|uniref:Stu1p n=1 Tax=Saccharomycodes ludwigii TaxID=36035 RepID=UPI001E8B4278|nr:hypothetical protein SCDLUD_000768 [Saccharomycodes ludwigii]KAH3903154.1 hypothetical protein SCDLUD_000768 [Saccharomycodes ludwigii]
MRSYDTFYEVLTSESDVSIQEKIKLLIDFKSHVKKEFVDVSLVPQYFKALFYYLENTIDNNSKHCQDPRLLKLCYSSFCHLVKRCSMQSPSSFTFILIKRIIIILLAHLYTVTSPPSNDHNNNNLVLDLNSKKALIGIYLVKNVDFNKAMQEILTLSPITHGHGGTTNNIVLKRNFIYFINEIIKLIEQNHKASSNDLFINNSSQESLRFLNSYKLSLVENLKYPELHDLIIDLFKTYEIAYDDDDADDTGSGGFTNASNNNNQNRNDDSSTSSPFDVDYELSQILPQTTNNNVSTNNRNSTLLFKPSSPLRNYSKLEFLFKDLDAFIPHFSNKESEFNWKKRQNFILKLRSILNCDLVLQNKREFIEHCKVANYTSFIYKSVNSLRTTLSIHACNLIKELAIIFKEHLDPLQEPLFDSLRPLLGATKKISVNNANSTILYLLAYCHHFNKKIFQSILNLCKEKTLQPRISSCKFLKIFIIKYPMKMSLGNSELIRSWFIKNLTDPQVLVRNESRLLFWYYYKIQPVLGKKLLFGLNLQTRKMLNNNIPLHLNIVLEGEHINTNKRNADVDVYPNSTKRRHLNTSLGSHTAAVSTMNNNQRKNQRAYSDTSALKIANGITTENNITDTRTNAGLNRPNSSAVGSLTKRNIRSFTTSYITGKPNALVENTPNHNNTLSSDINDLTSSFNSPIHSATKYNVVNSINNNAVHSPTLTNNGIRSARHSIVAEIVDDLDPIKDYASKCKGVTSLEKELKKTNLASLFDNSLKISQYLRSFMLKDPGAIRPLLLLQPFYKLFQPPNYLIEAFSINNEIDILKLVPTFSNVEILKIITHDIFSQAMHTDLESSIYYVKNRKKIFDYCLRSCIALINNLNAKSELDESFGVIVDEIFKIWGKDFNEEVYFELINVLFKFDEAAFIQNLRQQALSLKLNISYGLTGKNENFTINEVLTQDEYRSSGALVHKSELNSQPSSIENIDNQEEKDLMEMTKINVWSSAKLKPKNNNSIKIDNDDSSGSVVVHELANPPHNDNKEDNIKKEAIDKNQNENINPNGNEVQDHTVDTKKLNEMTKIISIYQPKSVKYNNVYKNGITVIEEESQEPEVGKNVDLRDIFHRDESNSSIIDDTGLKKINLDTEGFMEPEKDENNFIISTNTSSSDDLQTKTTQEKTGEAEEAKMEGGDYEKSLSSLSPIKVPHDNIIGKNNYVGLVFDLDYAKNTMIYYYAQNEIRNYKFKIDNNEFYDPIDAASSKFKSKESIIRLYHHIEMKNDSAQTYKEAEKLTCKLMERLKYDTYTDPVLLCLIFVSLSSLLQVIPDNFHKIFKDMWFIYHDIVYGKQKSQSFIFDDISTILPLEFIDYYIDNYYIESEDTENFEKSMLNLLEKNSDMHDLNLNQVMFILETFCFLVSNGKNTISIELKTVRHLLDLARDNDAKATFIHLQIYKILAISCGNKEDVDTFLSSYLTPLEIIMVKKFQSIMSNL